MKVIHKGDNVKIKDIASYTSIIVLIVGVIYTGAIAKQDVDESKQKITKLEQAQIDYQTQQAVLTEQTETLKESVDELKESVRDGNKALLEAIQKKR